VRSQKAVSLINLRHARQSYHASRSLQIPAAKAAMEVTEAQPHIVAFGKRMIAPMNRQHDPSAAVHSDGNSPGAARLPAHMRLTSPGCSAAL
jgi:hypothetical protein